MRDRLIHGYIGVDISIVWETITTDLPMGVIAFIPMVIALVVFLRFSEEFIHELCNCSKFSSSFLFLH